MNSLGKFLFISVFFVSFIVVVVDNSTTHTYFYAFSSLVPNSHWPDFSNQDDLAQVGAEAFAFVNFARFAVPLRIGLALGSTGWVQENIVDRFMKNKKDNNEEIESTDPSA